MGQIDVVSQADWSFLRLRLVCVPLLGVQNMKTRRDK